nr:Gfo/Idh/MocA family oxidoreductase [Thalassobacillus pellis]
MIGTGSIARTHVKSMLELDDKCKLVALADIYPEKAMDLAQTNQLKAKIVSDYKSLLDDPTIDAVSICTPPYTHKDITVDFLRAGKHVLVEKPMASSLKECDEMIEAQKESGKILSVVAQNRFRTPIMSLKNVLDKELIGRIAHVQVDSFWWRGNSYYDLWWRGTYEKEGGGCTLNHAVHHIDMLQWMMDMPVEVGAMSSNMLHDNAEVEDISVALLKYANGALAQVTSSVIHHGEEQQLAFQGEKAKVSVPWKVKAEVARENGFPTENGNAELEKELEQEFSDFPKLHHEGHTGQINDFLTAIEGGTDVLINGIDGRKTLELIMAIYQAASTGSTVKLPLTKESPFYQRDGVLKNATYFFEKKKAVENFSDNEITTGGNY